MGNARGETDVIVTIARFPPLLPWLELFLILQTPPLKAVRGRISSWVGPVMFIEGSYDANHLICSRQCLKSRQGTSTGMITFLFPSVSFILRNLGYHCETSNETYSKITW
jgi:hypothetical protein